ncbi:hypothetical protein [Luteimonas sp. MC1750]|uniref:hypothetical protein n=1 Tax=Luteimonas sp. MC1750 TaxID=2799326 RepID=UPI0018F0CDF3|nr:hypothetical protein [Luteimonas sp. MC1750]MBJ6983285.1 hypothetical protein [Luteimonas sp. MC1750]QQO06151.1 hypothetical protein JGR68_01475 [Luteimonas sp. MC1750]
MNDRRDTNPDANRDPITGAPGAHPVGVAAGGTAGAIAGAAVGSLFGPIGTLVGGGIGAVSGAAGGKAIAERVDPTAEVEYWREGAVSRDYYQADRDFDRDYAPAYRMGTEYRNEAGDRDWNEAESQLKQRWDESRAESSLDWDSARPAVQDAYDRTHRTYGAYQDTDSHFEQNYNKADYYSSEHGFDDYRPAYRYGTQARTSRPNAAWSQETESELERGWDRARGESKLGWQQAKGAVKDAWHRVETKLPGDADGDGR